MAKRCSICCEEITILRPLEYFQCPSCMEKGDADKMTCRNCIEKCGRTCPWCRTTIDPSLPRITLYTQAGTTMEHIVVVKRKTLRRCLQCCAPCGFSQNVSIGATSCVVSTTVFLLWFKITCDNNKYVVCYFQALLLAAYVGGFIPILMRRWDESHMASIGMWHGLVGCLFFMLLLLRYNRDYNIGFLLLILCGVWPFSATFSANLNNHWH